MKIPFFRISGLFIFICSLLSLILVKSLFVKFLSTAILLLFVYLTVYYVVFYFYYGKKNIELASFDGKNLLPFKRLKIEIFGNNLPSFFPGIFFSIKYDVTENKTLIKKVCEAIEEIDPVKMIFSSSFDRHGKYHLENFRFVFQDIFGFTSYEISCDFDQEITVLPYFTEEIEIPYVTDEGGDQAIQSTSKVNSTDFFENRKYYPGDDIRRLNWKVFAHINELHVREVEKIPPKVGEISLLFAPYSENLAEYEYISSLFFSTCYFLLENGFELAILVPYSKNPVFINGNNESEFNIIIFNSYKPFSHTDIQNMKTPVVFASMQEFANLMNTGLLKRNCHCKVSFAETDESIKSIYRSIFRIDNFDSLMREIADKSFKLKKKKSEEKNLEKLLETGLSKNINSEIFRITYAQFEKFK